MRCGGGFSISISISIPISTCPQWRERSTAIILHSYVTLRTGARFTQRPEYSFMFSLHQNKCDSDFYLNIWTGCIRRLYFVLRPVCGQMTAVSWVGSLKQYTRQRLSFILDGYIGYIGYTGYNYADITAGMLRAGGQCPARPAPTESAWRRCCSTGPGGEGSCINYIIIMIFTI